MANDCVNNAPPAARVLLIYGAPVEGPMTSLKEWFSSIKSTTWSKRGTPLTACAGVAVNAATPPTTSAAAVRALIARVNNRGGDIDTILQRGNCGAGPPGVPNVIVLR